MSAQPQGRLESRAFLLTDIEGSTPLWEKSAPVMELALPRHDEIVATVMAAHGGHLILSKGEGDSTFSVFEDAGPAVAAAVELQAAMAAEAWPAGTPIRVRIAVHEGEVISRAG